MLTDTLLHRGLVPDLVVRGGIRRLLGKRLEELYAGGVEAAQERFSSLLDSLREAPIAVQTTDANDQHYEVPAAFYQKVLGHRLKYSCGYWAPGTTDLDSAEDAMLERTLARADIGPGMDVLDLGCGWGSFSLYAAERRPDCRFWAVSNAHGQKRYIERRAAELGLTNLTVHTADINDLTLDQRFHRVVSVEMFEHMRNYARLLDKVASWLHDDGKLFVHIFVHCRHAYLFEDRDATDWMARRFFSGGIMPSDHLLMYFCEAFRLQQHWHVDGIHYQKTADAWLANMDTHRDAVRRLFADTYGEGEAASHVHAWRIFFMACSELWGYRRGTEWFVGHYLFEKR